MKKYYILTPMNDVEYIGKFPEFRDAWDYLEYNANLRYVWLISENSMKKLNSLFTEIMNDDRIQEFIG